MPNETATASAPRSQPKPTSTASGETPPNRKPTPITGATAITTRRIEPYTAKNFPSTIRVGLIPDKRSDSQVLVSFSRVKAEAAWLGAANTKTSARVPKKRWKMARPTSAGAVFVPLKVALPMSTTIATRPVQR